MIMMRFSFRDGVWCSTTSLKFVLRNQTSTPSMSESVFKIAIPDDKLTTLHAKLELATLPDELDDAGWNYGAPLSDIQKLVARWKNGFDWRQAEKQINEELPMFTRDIDIDNFGTLNIHYVHQKSQAADAIPLLFVHGWPGNFLEVRKLLPLLTSASPDYPSFHVVALSLPGFGFSEAPHKPGFKENQYAEVGNKLMMALGYNEYVTQGGDWGHLITRTMAFNYGGKQHKAWHTNYPVAFPPTFLQAPLTYLSTLVTPLSTLVTPLTPEAKAGHERTTWFRTKGMGYSAEQSTQPQTLGYALADSPIGLLSWIYEKLVVWTDEYPWDEDEVLTWISIYWFSRAGPAASSRIYFEMETVWPRLLVKPPRIPTGVSYFPKEIIISPRSWVHAANNIVFESNHVKGGHFAALEQPKELADALRKMFGRGGPCFGIVPGKLGYA
ncbi:Alpha/Beta hydrolase protein [Hygrophoropsis aurantiaca]|uniref:Alpha/Beta hydrolase protein n=1 Tax=Hygrophoropsis aurantiaca TaxID=72124 RepID=A0ACB8A6D5_9AGAM|nr:Alpha/Beta hydrolase protein [Hygrophoropsis aurantiaca]